MHAHDQSSISSTGRKFRPDYALLLELHALTLVARSYGLLPRYMRIKSNHMLHLDLCTCKQNNNIENKLNSIIPNTPADTPYAMIVRAILECTTHTETEQYVLLHVHCNCLQLKFTQLSERKEGGRNNSS